MTNSLMCIACLATGTKMHSIRNTRLQEIFEKLANVRLDTGDRLSENVCFICCFQLQKCYRFMIMSQKAGKILAEALHSDSIQTVSLLAGNRSINSFVTTVIEPTSITFDTSQEATVGTSADNLLTESNTSVDKNMTVSNSVISIIVKEEVIEMEEDLVMEGEIDSVKREPKCEDVDNTTECPHALAEDATSIDSEKGFIKKELETAKQNIEHDKKATANKNKITKKKGRSKKKGILTTEDQNSKAGDNNLLKVKKQYTKEKGRSEVINHTCNICDASFKFKYYLIRHLRIHTGEKPFDCTICKKSFTQNGHLNQHMRLHTGEKPYSCNICKNKSFSHRYNYKSHMRKHFGVPTHQCNICDASFHQKGDLKRHLMTHTGEKPYPCETCGTRFSQRCHLTKHILIHTKDKPYSCSVCKEDFAKKKDLAYHKETHGLDKPYHCTYEGCTKSFCMIKSLTNHFKIHAESLSCDYCHRTYKQKGRLAKHICKKLDSFDSSEAPQKQVYLIKQSDLKQPNDEYIIP